jgi:hypothetical protein
MPALHHLGLKLLARGTHAWYMRREKSLAALPGRSRALSILFSARDAWETSIRRGFAGLPHRPHFGELRASDLERYDLIVPLSLDDVEWVRRQPPHVRERMVPLPDAEVMALCHDKPRLNRALTEAGFAPNVPPMGEGVEPPYICKPAQGENSEHCLLVADRDAELRLGNALADPRCFRQAAVAGTTEYATHFVARKGRLQRELTVRYHHDTPLFIKGSPGSQPLAKTLGRCPDPGTIEAMLRAIRYDGLGCANFKIDAAGRLQLLEINPRMGGSLSEYFYSFLRSMPQIWRTRSAGCTNWTWLDSLVERDSRFGPA